MTKQPPATKEQRAQLKARLDEATVNLEAYVARLAIEVERPGTEVMMATEDQVNTPTSDESDIFTGTAAGNAAYRLADDAKTAKRKLDAQAETAAGLLISQAARLATSVEGLRQDVTNLEHRTVMTEERASLAEERANLVANRGGTGWVWAAVGVVVVAQVAIVAAGVWVHRKPGAVR